MTTDMERQNRFTVLQAEQRTPEWFEARLGRVTGSMAANVWGRTKKGERLAGWTNYQDQLLAERLTGKSAEDVFVTFDMQRGIDLEPLARRMLSNHIGEAIRETGFLMHNTLAAGSSLDGDIDDFNAVVEIKCPKTTTHLRYLEAGALPDTYEGQCLHNLYVSGADRLIFASFDDRLPKHLQLFVKEVQAKHMPLEEYEQDLIAFVTQLEQRHDQLAELAA